MITKHQTLTHKKTYKTGKKSKKSTETQQFIILQRARYTTIFKPIKFLNPLNLYVLPTDLVVTIMDDTIIVQNSTIHLFKGINSFECDHTSRMLRILLHDNSSHTLSLPWRYLIDRLYSFGNVNLKNWGDFIKKFCLGVESITNNFQEIFDKEFQENRDIIGFRESIKVNSYNPQISSRLPQLYVKKKFSKKGVNLVEIGANFEFVELLEFDLLSLKSLLAKNELPNVFSKLNRGQNLIKQLSTWNSDEEYPGYILTRKNEVKKVQYRLQTLNEIVNGAVYKTYVCIFDPGNIEKIEANSSEEINNDSSLGKEKISEIKNYLANPFIDKNKICTYRSLEKQCKVISSMHM